MFFERFSIVAPLLAMLLSSCTIKEDRSPCPCILTVDLCNVRGEYLEEMDAAMVAYECNEKGCFMAEEVPLEIEFEVPKSGVEAVFHSLGSEWGRISPGDSLIIPVGQECPCIYSYAKVLDTNHEVMRDTVVMHRNFTRVTVVAEAFEGIADSLCVTGNVKGYSFRGEPLVGPYSCSRVPDERSSITVAVPRQLDSSLKLLVRVNEETFRSFAIGWAITSSGYDWGAEELPDITIELDYACTRVSYSTDPWSETQSFTVEIDT